MAKLEVTSTMKLVGIDWAAEEHAVCVIDSGGAEVAAFMIAHTKDGFAKLVSRLVSLGVPGEMPVAIERPDGRLVDRLLEAGHRVVPVSGRAIKAWRESEVASGAKSDPGDAEVIAEYLRLRVRHLRVLEPFSDQTRALRAVVRARDDLVHARVAAHNQLEACLDAFWPGAKAIFADRDQRDRPGLLGALPHTELGQGPGRETPGRVLRQARLLRSALPSRAADPPRRRPRRHRCRPRG